MVVHIKNRIIYIALIILDEILILGAQLIAAKAL